MLHAREFAPLRAASRRAARRCALCATSRCIPVARIAAENLTTTNLNQGLVGQSFQKRLGAGIGEKRVPAGVSLDALQNLARNLLLLRLGQLAHRRNRL